MLKSLYPILKRFFGPLRLCVLILFFPLTLAGTPWGKDADLACMTPYAPPCHSESWLAHVGSAAIRFHQDVISPADGPRSHFIPSSSQYTLESMQKYGFFQGYLLGCDRLMRENEERWVYKITEDGRGRPIKLDPVK